MKKLAVVFGFILLNLVMLIIVTSVNNFSFTWLLPEAQGPVTDVKAGHQSNVSQGRLLWSGINWRVISQLENNTWVDDQGRLHMRLQKIGDTWCCTTLESPYTVKYGKFIWNISSPSLNLERNTSIGMFTYANDSNEIDIEINQWPGTDQHLYFVNQPGSVEDHPSNIYYDVYSNSPYLNATNITYIIDWEPTYVNFSAINSDGSIISNWNYTNKSEIPHVESTICQYFGTVANFTPQNEQPKEVVFNSFQYIGSKQPFNYESVDDPNPENETKFYKGTIDKLNELISRWKEYIPVKKGKENLNESPNLYSNVSRSNSLC